MVGPIVSDPSGQLVLPIVPFREATRTNVSIPPLERVFANRNLRMSTVRWLGFDMDYTLAIYDQEAMDTLSVEVTVEGLIRRGYPAYLRDIQYDTRFPIRGLLIDKKLGHVLKMNRFHGIQKAYHGTRLLTREEVSRHYWHEKVTPDSPRFHWIDTLFGLSEVTSYVAIVDALEAHDASFDFGRLFEDIRRSIDEAHANGEVHGRVVKDIGRFISKDPYLARTLHKLRSAGKKLFLLTNSPWYFTQAVMTYLLDGEMPEYRNWQQFFNVVIVAARKPLWFQGSERFYERKDDQLTNSIRSLQRGRIYQGGNLKDFEAMIGERGSGILYVGDHIYGDILRSKKHSVWRTAMIIQELGAELAAHQDSAAEIRRLLELEELREEQEDELRFYQMRWRELDRLQRSPGILAEKHRVKRAVEHVHDRLNQLNREQEKLERRVDQAFHPYWGSLVKEQSGLSSFGAQVGRYADIYMRRVSCLRHYSPEQFFRSPHDFMPHEL